MSDSPMAYDRTTEDLGNIVELGHVNTTVPDQKLATIFYVTGLGLTRDPYIMTGLSNMWVNVGRQQFHLPARTPQVLRGTTGLVLPDLERLLRRLHNVRKDLEGTKFAFHETNDGIETTCPWGNRIRCHTPDPVRFGPIRLGMPFVEFDIPEGTSLDGIARFYREILGGLAGVSDDTRGAYAWAVLGDGNKAIYRPTKAEPSSYDGHHIQITLANFSGPHRKLVSRDLITEESDQHQYRFTDIIDLDTGKLLFQIEHEVRSMRHPLYARPLVNRDPTITNMRYAPGYEAARWAMPLN
jgi:hypothetical protein